MLRHTLRSDPCSQELYQLWHSRETSPLDAYVTLDLQNRKSDQSAEDNLSTETH